MVAGATYINNKLIAKANLNVTSNRYWKPLKILFSKSAQQNSMILHTHSPWICVTKVCSNDGATWTCVCVIKVCSSGYNNNVKLYNITIIVHYNV